MDEKQAARIIRKVQREWTAPLSYLKEAPLDDLVDELEQFPTDGVNDLMLIDAIKWLRAHPQWEG